MLAEPRHRLAQTLPAKTPRSLWIELTSKCPFDCVFCSRKVARGPGEHMDFALYESLIRQLESPEIIRLNYSGESIHYPRLIDAIRLAKDAGATVELVSAFASISASVMRGLVESGLNRLSISLHSLESGAFAELYRFSSLETMQSRIEELLRTREEHAASTPIVDFAFVAMERNLDQLNPLAAYAKRLGIGLISVHPVIRRDVRLVAFPQELDGGDHLLPSFAARIEDEVERVRERYAEVQIIVSRPLHKEGHTLGLTTCDQNPWETIHVLANGDVVVCEVQDKTVMGSLTTQTLRGVWHGRLYQEFRENYLEGEVETCRSCPWRRSSEFIRGWYEQEPSGIRWSGPQSVMLVRGETPRKKLLLSGLLPSESDNQLMVSVNGKASTKINHSSAGMHSFDCDIELPEREGRVAVQFDVSKTLCPARSGGSEDSRNLGFALIGHSIKAELSAWFRIIDRAARTVTGGPARTVRKLPGPIGTGCPGISVLIPERGNACLLGDCLASLKESLAEVAEPKETIVFVNGSDPREYDKLQRECIWARFVFQQAPAGFSSAIDTGLRHVRFDWVYLLNSDMVLDRMALPELLALRAPDRFSIGSRIEMRDGSLIETNWSDMRIVDGLVEIWDAQPDWGRKPRGSLYCGGGSSLFQTRLLRMLVRRTCDYDPFYWEDVEWGVVARRHGYENLFCPGSRALHRRRATVSKYYGPKESDRIFQRNRFLFQFRNLCRLGHIESMFEALYGADDRTIREMMRRPRILRALGARWISARLPEPESLLTGTRERDASVYHRTY